MCRPTWIAVCVLLAGTLSLHSASVPAQSSGPRVGTFKLTFYYVAEERSGGDWPLYGPSCRRVLAHTSREFHQALSREGTGRLRDGRLLNFSERCACARPGHRGARICYVALDAEQYPWGAGAAVGGRPARLRPFRTVAVDPRVVPLGTVLFIPELAGRRGPDGSRLDGCVLAEDVGRAVQRRHLDLFAGRSEWARALAAAIPAGQVTVYRGGARCADPTH